MKIRMKQWLKDLFSLLQEKGMPVLNSVPTVNEWSAVCVNNFVSVTDLEIVKSIEGFALPPQLSIICLPSSMGGRKWTFPSLILHFMRSNSQEDPAFPFLQSHPHLGRRVLSNSPGYLPFVFFCVVFPALFTRQYFLPFKRYVTPFWAHRTPASKSLSTIHPEML